MKYEEITEQLKKIASTQVGKAVFLSWGLRKRGRNQVTVRALALRMQKEGFTYATSDYEEFLKRLAKAGLGRAITTHDGRIKALVEVKYTLQSIGQAALDGGKDLINLTKRVKFIKLPVEKLAKEAVAPTSGAVAGARVDIVFMVNNKPVRFHIPEHLDTNDIAVLVERFQKEASK